jgi:hypothetical protein
MKSITKVNAVAYQSAPYIIIIERERLWWEECGPLQTATGYGARLTTEYKLRLPDSSRSYRVYSVCYSNCASFYILRHGVRLFLRDWELEAARDAARGVAAA